jgi:glycosyltransferase involved in cell wall biosynthesis
LVTTCGGDAPFNDAGKDAGALGEGDHIVAGSEHVRELLIADDSARDGKVTVIPDGANLAVYAAEAVGPERLTTLARSWGMLEEPAPTILAPGPTVPERGKHVLARALGEIADAPGLSDLVAIIPGELSAKDSYAQQLAWIARKRGATGRIFLSGALTDIPAAMMLADIIVSVPVEPLGQDPIAAMAAGLGKPVIGADHGATAEVVVDGVTGRLAPPDDPDALGRAIMEILRASAKEKAEMSNAARIWALAKFSATGSALSVIRQYATLAEKAK